MENSNVDVVDIRPDPLIIDEPLRCTKMNPCCSCSIKGSARTVAIVILVISGIRFPAYITASALTNMVVNVRSGKNGTALHEEEFIDRAQSAFITLAVFSAFRVLACLLLIFVRRPGPGPCLLWMLIEIVHLIAACLTVALMSSYIKELNSKLGMTRLGRVWSLTKLSMVAGFEFPFLVWFVWVMGAYTIYLDRHEETNDAAGFDIVSRAAYLGKKLQAEMTFKMPGEDEELEAVPIQPNVCVFEVTAPGYVDDW